MYYQIVDELGEEVGILKTNANTEEVKLIWSEVISENEDVNHMESIVEKISVKYPDSREIIIDGIIYP